MNKRKKEKPTMMKYNKKEEQAVNVLCRFTDGLKNKKTVLFEAAECNLLKKIFGIDITNITLSKTEAIKKGFIRGKDKPIFVLSYYGEYNWCQRYCYFPFQIKK